MHLPKRSFATGRLRPDPGVRERRLFGGPLRTAGFWQGDRRRQDPQSTQSSCCL